ncbi:replication factor C subunit 5 isoform X1 [Condylostylus longicornis]|uniref:replication factor C subunit 5 isoform X1 n=1 Tax=Condylostylus longicornis TaxID=2530218 RepID=UPI00244DB182|nr:replication factor C subunit 5 isoform X1 [Condylostylus longicornis]
MNNAVVQSEKSDIPLPWVEKYRPQTLDDLVSHSEIVSTISKLVDGGNLPHLLFYGPPGTGKTSTILACVKRLYSPTQFKSMVLELNASDDRGINIVRGQILNFASTRTIFSGAFKLIILDEADAMTNDAQNALRRIIEKYTENVRFCLICNFLSKIIPAVQSRCTKFRFAPLSSDQILPRLNLIIQNESLKATEDGKKALLALSKGDMRKVVNTLQSTSMAFDIVNEINVYTCVGHPLRSDIERILLSLMSSTEFEKCYNGKYSWSYIENLRNKLVFVSEITKIKADKALALEDILVEIQLYVMRMEIPINVLNKIIVKISEMEERLSKGCKEIPQITALISTFFKCRNMITITS